MGIVKAISGHTGARGVMRYLERDGRALARDFLNIGAPIEGWEGDLPRYGACDWAAEMDSVREAAGNGRAWRGRAARTWKHYVLSPDPGSRVDLSTLRGLAVEWASEHFPDHQVAIVYHDDNEGRIPHAHVVVNNTSLETGRRLQVPDPLKLNRSFQRLEAERGLPHLSNEPLARPTARARRSTARSSRPWGSSSPTPPGGGPGGTGCTPSPTAPRGASAGSASASTTEGRPSAPPSSAGPLPSTAAREAVAVDGRAELDRLANAASTIWRRRARSLAALDGMAAAAERAWRRGEAEALRRAREFASEKSLLPQRSERPRRSLARGGGEAGAPRRKTTRDRGPERTRDERRGAALIVEIVYRDRPHSVFEAQPPGHADACIATETRLSLEPDGLWIEADRYEMGAAGDGAAPVAVRRRWWRLLAASAEKLSSAEAVIRDGRTAWWRLGDGFVDDRLLEAADRKWLEHGGGSAIGRVLKVDELLERANPSASLEERCAAMGMTPEMRDAAALAAEALGEEDYEDLAQGGALAVPRRIPLDVVNAPAPRYDWLVGGAVRGD